MLQKNFSQILSLMQIILLNNFCGVLKPNSFLRD